MSERQRITMAVVLHTLMQRAFERRAVNAPPIMWEGSFNSLLRAIDDAEDEERYDAWEERQRTE